MLSVPDLERSVSFYRDRLGLEAGYHDAHWAELKTGSFTLGLHITEQPVDPGALNAGPRIIFGSEDIVADRGKLLELGIQTSPLHQVAEHDDTVGITCDFNDPDGHHLSLFANLSRSQWKEIRNA
ncbi:MAG: VOC family protein [Candidatus Sericytochromatia bacterium]